MNKEKWVQLGKWILGFAVTGALAWSALQTTVEQNCASIDANRLKLERIDKRIRVVEDYVIEQRTDIKWVKESMGRIEDKLDK